MKTHKVFLLLEPGPFRFPSECGVKGNTVAEESLSWKDVTCEDCLKEAPQWFKDSAPKEMT